MGLQLNSITGDFDFQKAKQLLENTLGLQNGLNDNLLVNHTIRGEVQLNNSSTVFQIPLIATNQAQQFNTSNLLALQDMFVINKIGVFVGNPSSNTDALFKLYTYGDKNVFSGANVADSIEGMYNNANLKYTNNQRVVLPYWDLKRHHFVPKTQTAANAYFTASGESLVNAEDGTVDGFYPVQPSVLLNGGGNAVLELDLKAALTAVTTYQRLVVIIRGILLQNASAIK